jgi:hypothetical protein
VQRKYQIWAHVFFWKIEGYIWLLLTKPYVRQPSGQFHRAIENVTGLFSAEQRKAG